MAEGDSGWSGGSPADAGNASPQTTVTKTLDQLVADLSQADKTAAMIHGPRLLCALRATHAILLTLEERGEFYMTDVEVNLNVTGRDGVIRNILHLDGAQIMDDNSELLGLIKKDPDDG